MRRVVSPVVVLFVAAFLILVAAPMIGVVVLSLKQERLREQREAEDRAHLWALAEQQRRSSTQKKRGGR